MPSVSQIYPSHSPRPQSVLRRSRTSAVSCPHARQKSREQYPPPARLYALTSRLHECVEIRNYVVDAIVLSRTDAASQETVVGSAQHVTVARARARRDAVVKYCLEYELDGGARSVVHFEDVFRKLHHACVPYAPVDLDRQVGIVVDISPDASQ